MGHKTRVLLVCIANSARSHMAGARLRHTAPERFEALGELRDFEAPAGSSRTGAYRHVLHEIHERLRMFMLVKSKPRGLPWSST